MGLLQRSGNQLVFCMLLTDLLAITAQITQPKSGCTFLDDRNVFNIEVLKGNHDAACPTSEDVNDQFKSTENKLAETTYEVMQLQTKVLKLMDTNVNLTLEVQRLHDELRATQIALQTRGSVSVECPPGYQIKSEEWRSCYMFVAREFTWMAAETFCMSTRAHLVAIESEKEQQYLVDYIRSSEELPGSHIWTGGNDLSKEDQWLWAGQNTVFQYTAWTRYPIPGRGMVQQPDNRDGSEDCVHLYHILDYEWNDAHCNEEYYFICEYKLW